MAERIDGGRGQRHGLAAGVVLATALLATATGACTNSALQCLVCASLVFGGGDTEEDPRSVREWPTPLGRVRETFWTPFSMPDSSFDCRYVLFGRDGAGVPLGLVQVETHSCGARRAPMVDDSGNLIVSSGGAFVVWNPHWPRPRDVPLGSMTFRRTVLTTLDPMLRIAESTWTITVFGADAFVSVDGGATWRSAHPDAQLD